MQEDKSVNLTSAQLTPESLSPVCWLVEGIDGYRGVTFIDPATSEGAYDGFTVTPLVRAAMFQSDYVGAIDKSNNDLMVSLGMLPGGRNEG